MKSFLLILALAFAGPAMAERPVALGWSPQQDASTWRVYRITPQGRGLLATVTGRAVTVTLPDESCVVAIAALSQGSESILSLPLSVAAVEDPVILPAYQVTLTLAEGDDPGRPQDHVPVAVHTFIRTAPKKFYSLKIETAPVTTAVIPPP